MLLPLSVSKAETEADDLGVTAVLDEGTLYRVMSGELHDYPQKIVRARIGIAERRLF